jgi:hypothetical protein
VGFGDVVDYQGVLQFIAEDGTEVVVSSMPFIAKELPAVEEQKEVQNLNNI